MIRKMSDWLFALISCVLIFALGIVTGYDANRIVENGKTAEATETESADPNGDGPATIQIKFNHIGDAGSLVILNNDDGTKDYNVGLYAGKDISSDASGQKIVDNDYSALYAKEPLLDDGWNQIEGETITVIMDHDLGTPAALPATRDNDVMLIRTSTSDTDYKKVAQFTTGDRKTADLMTESGHDVREKSFIEEFGDPTKLVMFITCQDDGRLVTLWSPTQTIDTTK